MEVLHISFSRSGGAGQVAVALNKALQELGHKSTIKTVTERNLWENPLSHPLLTAIAAIDEFFIKSKKAPTLFSALRSQIGSPRLEREIIASTAQVVHLHWISGILSSHSIQRIEASGKKILWTLHDMAPFTGGCHQSFDCGRYQLDCSGCPQVRPFFTQIPLRNLQNSEVLAQKAG